MPLLVPDSGPLISLAYIKRLPLLFELGWNVQIVDMVLHEVTRNKTSTSATIDQWIKRHSIQKITTSVYTNYMAALAHAKANDLPEPNSFHLGELAIQEYMVTLHLNGEYGMFLFEDMEIAETSFFLPPTTKRYTTMAYLLYLQRRGKIKSANAIANSIVAAGRNFCKAVIPPTSGGGNQP